MNLFNRHRTQGSNLRAKNRAEAYFTLFALGQHALKQHTETPEFGFWIQSRAHYGFHQSEKSLAVAINQSLNELFFSWKMIMDAGLLNPNHIADVLVTHSIYPHPLNQTL